VAVAVAVEEIGASAAAAGGCPRLAAAVAAKCLGPAAAFVPGDPEATAKRVGRRPPVTTSLGAFGKLAIVNAP
jgi:hypothetical protein